MASSLKGLVDSGTSCGAANPLVQLSSHLSRDAAKREQHRRHHTRPTATPTSYFANSRTADEDFVEDFLRESGRRAHYGPPKTFNMQGLLRQMPLATAEAKATSSGQQQQMFDPTKAAAPVGAVNNGAWIDEFMLKESNFPAINGGGGGSVMSLQPGVIGQGQNSSWAREYLDHVETSTADSFSSSAPLSSHHTAPETLMTTKNSWIAESDQSTVVQQEEGSAWKWADEFFAKADISGNQTTSATAAGVASSQHEELELAFKESEKEVASSKSGVEEVDFWQNLENEWKREESDWLTEFEPHIPYENYEFVEDNPFKDNESCLQEGKKKLAEGDIPSAVLLFEGAVRQHPENVEAWTLLGTTQAKNEQDPAAIAALKRALSLAIEPDGAASASAAGDPEAAALADGRSEAIMTLAASLTNESYQAHACHALQDWIHLHPEYRRQSQFLPLRQESDPHHLTVFEKPLTSSFMSKELHEQTKDMFLKVARFNNSRGQVDADVQSGLGILLSLSGDYDRAVDCFNAALNSRPNDAQLWNRLGATLANGRRSEEAVSAYRNALSQSPGFVRARYNLGISCINLKSYKEAVEHFMAALNFQAAGSRGLKGRLQGQGQCMSDNIWSSLRFCLSLMGKSDLYKLLNNRDLDQLNSILMK